MHTNTFVITLLNVAGCYNQPRVLATFMEGDDLQYSRDLEVVQEAGNTVSCNHVGGWSSVYAEDAGLLYVNNPASSQGGLFYVHGYQDRCALSNHLRNIA